ncbi:MAG TPA: hypothetical protein VGS98_05110 [Thermoanaerobaculia bacterium]|nr:hypothetical protein [Thermoanaerobaculia bacterium]
MFSAAAESENTLVFGATLPTEVQGPTELGPLSIRNPPSLNEPSVHERSMRLGLTAFAAKPDGAIGIVCGVVALTTFESAEKEVCRYARTR